ncbi:cyclin/Brf1-like TBP-binding protein isoform X2 [Wolffia australiana]
MKGRDEIRGIVYNLSVAGGDSIINQAHAFYKMAVERNFTRGRSTSQVAAACLYIACRQNMKPYLLIDFSDYLRINVYVLGAVFLQLCQLLRLEEHPIVQKPVDPSLFIHRFAERLLGEKNSDVIRIALTIIGSMKRDWLQTGRKPSGLCGAALYIAALSQGLKYSKSDVVNVVYICEATLTKRLIEFESTKSGSLTIEEFITKADEERDMEVQPPITAKKTSEMKELLCEHKDRGGVHFAHGLCKDCYDEFIEISGGIQGGSEPPAFQHAERERMKKVAAEGKNQKALGKLDSNAAEDPLLPKAYGNPGPQYASRYSEKTCKDSGADTIGIAEEESLSDIDDFEVSGYLHNEEEKEFKKIIWEKMNKEFIEEQAAKEAAAAAAKEAYEAAFANCSDEVRAAQELAIAAAEAAARTRKERRQKRAEEAKNAPQPQNAAEATRQMLKRKTFSSKINYAALDALLSSDEGGVKKQRSEADDDKQVLNKEEDGKHKQDDTVTADYQEEHDMDQEAYDEEGDYNAGDYDGGYNGVENEEFEYEFY